MATNEVDDKVYNKIEDIIMHRVFVLENENSKLKQDLAFANAKLEVYERIATLSDSKVSVGFGPPTRRDEE